jgi:hypothetical protein
MPCQFCTQRGHTKYTCPVIFPEVEPIYKQLTIVYTKLYRGEIDAEQCTTMLEAIAMKIIAMTRWLRSSKDKDV